MRHVIHWPLEVPYRGHQWSSLRGQINEIWDTLAARWVIHEIWNTLYPRGLIDKKIKKASVAIVFLCSLNIPYTLN